MADQPRLARDMDHPGPPLADIRVLDFTHMIAGPYGTQLMAYFGAEVIKVESAVRPDGFRKVGQGASGQSLNVSPNFGAVNRSKRDITVNMATSGGRDLARRLIPLCDVIMENFSPGVLRRWGLDYPSVRGLRPDIVMVSLQGMGQRGPRRHWVTWGPSLMPYVGLTWMWGYPDQPEPVGSQIAYPDYVVATQAAFAALAALDYRRRTGAGQYIELAQVAGAASLLPTTFLDYFVNGRVPPRQGNSSPWFAPYGCYPCQGDDRWCVIAVTSDEEWEAFREAIGNPSWTRDARFQTMSARVRHRDALDAHVAQWTRQRDPHDIMGLLQSWGVAAGAVQDGRDLSHDEHLRQRDVLVPVEHPEMSTLTYPGIPLGEPEADGVDLLQLVGQGPHLVPQAVVGHGLVHQAHPVRRLAVNALPRQDEVQGVPVREEFDGHLG